MIACVADGAGSAARSDLGARIACQTWVQQMRLHTEQGWGFTSNYGQRFALEARNAIRNQASIDKAPLAEYACTFLGACLRPEQALFVQIGDGAIVIGAIAEVDQYEVVFWPDQGEYANTTTFLTDELTPYRTRSWSYSTRIDKVALFSDGLQRLALNYETQSAFAPFFNSMFEHLRESEPIDRTELSFALSSFLDSDPINDRTDDDKTLVLATRLRAPYAAPES